MGGIKEKILAAKRAGIKDIILCEDNRKDIEEIQPMYLEGVAFHYEFGYQLPHDDRLVFYEICRTLRNLSL